MIPKVSSNTNTSNTNTNTVTLIHIYSTIHPIPYGYGTSYCPPNLPLQTQIHWAHLCNKISIPATTSLGDWPGNSGNLLGQRVSSHPELWDVTLERISSSTLLGPSKKADSHQVLAGWPHSEQWICSWSLLQRFDLWQLDPHSLLPPKASTY